VRRTDMIALDLALVFCAFSIIASLAQAGSRRRG
jgi:hypothetical protein